jgi:predicted DNA-binding transcriptional regulator AlpA
MTAKVELDDLLDSEQTSNLLGIKRNTLEIWRCKGKGPAFVKLGEHPSSPIRYQRSRVIAWIEAQTFASTSAYTAANRPA